MPEQHINQRNSAATRREERYSGTAEQKIVIRYRDIGVLGAFAEETRKIADKKVRQTAKTAVCLTFLSANITHT